MEVIIRENEEVACGMVARIIAKAVRKKPDLVLGLATGRTMEKVYAELARMHRDEALDFSACRTFNLDEYIGLEQDDVNSYHHYMDEHLFRHINIKPGNTHLPDGTADDLKAEARGYEEKMCACGGIDLQLLGIGQSGHIGFNEPLSSLMSRMRDKVLAPETIAQNGPLFKTGAMPKRAMTMGVGTILESRRALVLVTGEGKADILAESVEGAVTSRVTASALQLHPHCVVVVDEAAASKLQDQEYFKWIYENEPEWDEFRI
ncbi:glucosamine-6-phosphate deaminase [Pontiella sulfatireligans]|uniref:Glucosamine-6-phosphate deaminase n=1 Tax=Pontiella sulfatireligans TaxID=2750658 RepID=A0A6C2USY9_9BACT|nr:glucosamine-6-phosphate deaminase [Pontiella sulfatireligans]VGO22337.1 Glucosamine-6-phosphate deaminase 1 [Pontiella sulfatireligans]